MIDFPSFLMVICRILEAFCDGKKAAGGNVPALSSLFGETEIDENILDKLSGCVKLTPESLVTKKSE